MTPLETLILIFIIIETGQIFVLVWNMIRVRRTLEAVVSDPELLGQAAESLIVGFIDRLSKDEKLQASVGGVVAWMGRSIMSGATGGDGGPVKPVKLPGMLKIFEPFVNNPQFQGMIAKKIGSALEKTGNAAVEKAVDGWI